MHGILLRLRRSLRTTADKGASAVEYGLMVAAIAALIVGVVFALGGVVKGALSKTCRTISAQASPAPAENCSAPQAQGPRGRARRARRHPPRSRHSPPRAHRTP